MAIDRVAELRRLDAEAKKSRAKASQAQTKAMKVWVSLLADEMQATAESFNWTFEDVLTEHFFGDQKLTLQMQKDTYFGQLITRAREGNDLWLFESIFNNELEARKASIRLKTDGSWYGTIFVAA